MDIPPSQKRKALVDTPEQEKNQWIESVEREWRIRKNHAAASAESEGISRIAAGHSGRTSYFNNNKEHEPISVYNRRFHINHGYYQKLRRDDRMHTLGLNVHAEEEGKAIPILSSSVYGKRKPLDMQLLHHNRTELIRKEFYRNGGTNIPSGQGPCDE